MTGPVDPPRNVISHRNGIGADGANDDKADLDSTPLLTGLPGDRCTSSHWGYVFKGKLIYTLADREEVHQAGDAFCVPGGHLQRVGAGTEYVQFSPANELRIVSETMMKNIQRPQEA